MLTVGLLLVHQKVLQNKTHQTQCPFVLLVEEKQTYLPTRDNASIKDSLDSNSEGNTVEICVNTERFDITT